MSKHTILVACRNANGEADLAVVEVEADNSEVLEGAHYDYAIEKAEEEGYESYDGNFLCFDESDARNIKGIDESLLNNSNKSNQFMIVFCRNANGDPDFTAVNVIADRAQIAEGLHYDLATEKAEEDGYEAPFICFDEAEQRNIYRITQA